jgi:hypothetical protein
VDRLRSADLVGVNGQPSMDENSLLENAIERGIEFLRNRQLPNGRFRTLSSRSKDLSKPKEDSSVFATAVVAYSLSFCEKMEARAIKQNALSFLVREMHAPGFWSYWTSDSSRTIAIDLDDTACASLALKINGRTFPENTDRLLQNRDEQGRFKTWLFDERLMSFEKDLPVTQHDNIDPVVNANVLAHLGYSHATQAALEYVMEWIQIDDCPGNLGYYVDKLALYYAVSRALDLGVGPLCTVREPIAQVVFNRFRSEGRWDALLNAFGVCTLLNLSVDSEGLYEIAREIIHEQRCDGSWPAVAMYFGINRFHGSAELTTAVCLEALVRLRLRHVTR